MKYPTVKDFVSALSLLIGWDIFCALVIAVLLSTRVSVYLISPILYVGVWILVAILIPQGLSLKYPMFRVIPLTNTIICILFTAYVLILKIIP